MSEPAWRQRQRTMAEVTARRLLDNVEQFPEAWDGRERDALALVRTVLHEIADNERG